MIRRPWFARRHRKEWRARAAADGHLRRRAAGGIRGDAVGVLRQVCVIVALCGRAGSKDAREGGAGPQPLLLHQEARHGLVWRGARGAQEGLAQAVRDEAHVEAGAG
eukprot:2523972-Prymnesium_polylepis.1